eukprot:CAMPEP_0201719274 /NCGR_PEP_ID=MMETSP0593-20130828/4504_1 /ASSEMBLY_ACC=CAM_ASM_000672 /TAXON_ID=267983 /ORGANISM="Skeletonema japonicum, Strain CCMP2506" /LENGTH=574 /DNA_ID=CAMNT_0048209673 /DNA_START=207 /DNA_END=1928 /DNA_ORIENTATION=+
MHAPMSVGNMMQGNLGSTIETKRSAVDCQKLEEELIEIQLKEELAKHNKISDAAKSNNNDMKPQDRRFPKTMEKFANGIARVNKDKLGDFFDFGNPLSKGKGTGQEDALIIYHSKGALPTDESVAHSVTVNDGNGIPLLEPQTATENCDAMNVVFTANPGNARQCTALIGNFESYHIQRWMRVDTVKTTAIDPDLPLQLVSRGYAARGKANFYAPPSDSEYSPVRRHWGQLKTFLQNVDKVLEELTPILKKVARNNAVVVMTVNMGQSSLLMNFACSARRRGFDLGNVLVFPTDLESKKLAEGLGLATYYDESNMSAIPIGEARRYGDKIFRSMMYAKVLCVLYPLLLNYDVLFQDVDIVWYKDPVPFFQDSSDPKVANFDVLFQHDGSDSVRYAPYSANSGFYYVRSNKRSQYLFTSLLYHSDLIITWDSHQQVLIQVLAEHSSLFGLNVKIFSRDTEYFPGGWQFHQRKDFMKRLSKGETDSYIFHMSWTENKDNKLLFLRQLGQWFVEEQCVGKSAEEILGSGEIQEGASLLVEPCCAAEALVSCHYPDKPSVHSCKGKGENIDKHGRSFW